MNEQRSEQRSGSERFAERTSALAFLLSAAAFIGLAAVYWRGGQPQAEGVLLATGFAGLAYGLVTWGNHLLPPGPVHYDGIHLTGSYRVEGLLGFAQACD